MFIKGDLVEHVPSGCVGIFENYNFSEDSVRVAFQAKHVAWRVVGWWDALDCRPYGSNRISEGLVNAIKIGLDHAEWFDNDLEPIAPGYSPLLRTKDYNAIKQALAVVEDSEQSWITDRDPAKEDTWKNNIGIKWIMVWKRGSPKRCELYLWKGEPWQPLPKCLRTTPNKLKSCKTCKHGHVMVEQTTDNKIWVCLSEKVTSANFGMEKCNWEAV